MRRSEPSADVALPPQVDLNGNGNTHPDIACPSRVVETSLHPANAHSQSKVHASERILALEYHGHKGGTGTLCNIGVNCNAGASWN